MTAIATLRNGEGTDCSVAGHFVRLLTDDCVRRGLPLNELLTECGLAADCVDDPNRRIPFLKFDALLSHVAKRVNDDALGVKLGSVARVGHLGITGVVQQACRNGWEVMPRLTKYSVLTQDAYQDEFEIHGSEATLNWRCRLPDGIPVSRHQAELNFSMARALVQQLTGISVAPSRIQFRHMDIGNRAVLEDHFRCPVAYGAPVDSLSFSAAILDLPINFGSDPQSLKILEDLCDRQIQALYEAQDPDWMRAAQSTISAMLPQGRVEVEHVAQALEMPTRKLRRLLAERGLSFRWLVDRIRQELANQYLTHTELSLVDIAVRLGFSEQSAFQRAYRRWAKNSPGQVRRDQRKQG